MEQSTSKYSALVDIVADPKKALRAVEGEGWIWLPLILLIAIPALVTTHYFQTVDFNWVVDQLIASSGGDMPEEARDFLTPQTMMISTVIGQVVGMPLILAITALYFLLVNKFTSANEMGFKNWFSLVVWAAVPMLLASIAMFVYYVTAGTNQVGLEELNFFSLNALLTQYPMGHKAATFMSSISLFTFWNIGLLTLGLVLWTKRTWAKSLMIVVAPYVVIYGVWSFSAFG